ncbi:MAG: phosphate/phosphite/phosphonate ABC transporter substrate-binding protein [Thermodesulfovibrionales bacterium]|nr:phosphate/phosphite/phosphonate ABC transporter substrate-binding protein [Thermodesulfovibrionales bacterium]
MTFSILLVGVFFLGAESETSAKDKAVKRVVHFSAITLYHPIMMYQRYQPLMNYLTEHTSYHFELRLSQDYRNIINFLRNNDVQIALLGGATYLEAKEQFNIMPILKPLGPDGKPYYRSVFIARADNKKINKLSDLKGKSVAFASERSTSGYLVPLNELYAKGGITLRDLSKHVNLKYHDSVAREVLRGNFDAGAVIDSVANGFENRGLKIIAFSDPIPGLPIVVRADLSPEIVAAIKKALLSLDYNNPEHRKVMRQWDEEFRYGFVEAEDSDYNSIRAIVAYLIKKGVKIPR